MYIGFARRWPRLRSRSYIIDTEAVACDRSFDLVHRHRVNDRVFLYAFDLIELNGDDLRHDPLEGRTATLGLILAKAWPAFVSTSTWRATDSMSRSREPDHRVDLEPGRLSPQPRPERVVQRGLRRI
jgi:ATP-dependent DNA ligase